MFNRRTALIPGCVRFEVNFRQEHATAEPPRHSDRSTTNMLQSGVREVTLVQRSLRNTPVRDV